MKNMLIAATIAGIALAGVILYFGRNNPTISKLINADGTPVTY